MLTKTSLRFVILLIVQCASENSEDTDIVECNAGRIKGTKARDGNYFMYLGIPYATVDTRNPFSSSTPSILFEGIFEADDDTYVCPHTHQKDNTVIGTLDCLRLNVYVPETNSVQTNLAVMVWIHGGSFKHGQGGRRIFGPSYLVQHNVIVVTFNYRIGPYGFMCLDMPDVSGNQGLKDQYLALQWIKSNIEAFGGDVNKITLFGEGAGAHSIDLHLMSTKEALYNKVILQSGSAQSVTVVHEPDKLAPLKMARYIGFKTGDVKDAVYYLSNTRTNLVLNAAKNLKIQFKPCAESLFDNVEPFISQPWIDSNVSKIKGMPVLMGFNKHELARSLLSKNVTNYNSSAIISDNLNNAFYLPEQELNDLSSLVSRFYFVGDENPQKETWGVINFISDFTYVHPIHRTMQKYLESGAHKIYFYVMSYVGERNAIITQNYDENESSKCCVSHADDLIYLFSKENRFLNEVDRTIMLRMTTMWTNFAKFSDPTPRKSELLPIRWRPVSSSIYYYLDIDGILTLKQRPFHSRMAFWDLFYRQNKMYQQGYEEEQ